MLCRYGGGTDIEFLEAPNETEIPFDDEGHPVIISAWDLGNYYHQLTGLIELVGVKRLLNEEEYIGG